MATFNIKIEGLEAAIERLDPVKFKENIQDAFDAFGQAVVKDAKLNAPTDEGRLKNAINTDQIQLGAEINVNVDYAAYIEFGTRKFAESYIAQLPSDWKTFAAQYKGQGGGDFKEFVKRLAEWGRRTGKIPPEAAYVAALKILRNGIEPRPYLYPAFEKNKPQLIKDLEAI